MGKRPDRRSDGNLRTVLAQEAARLICDHGIVDYRAAKQKAAEKLGLLNFGALPTNQEIEAAVAERNRIFGAARQQFGHLPAVGGALDPGNGVVGADARLEPFFLNGCE